LDSVLNLKQDILSYYKLDPEESLHLCYKDGKVLDEELSLSHYGIKDGSIVFAVELQDILATSNLTKPKDKKKRK